MVNQKELDERLKAIDAQLYLEERDWQEEERKLHELEETYLRDTIVHGNIFTGWGEAKSAPIRFRNAALRKKKRERQENPSASVALSEEELLKVDKNRLASYSSTTSPAEPIQSTLEARETAVAQRAAARNAKKACR
ncbi:hypothetical protein Poli38472_005255 [Pythium oligandrum]|uniref:Chromatin modification-related protein MEAF6 n=1 Tax=Pythium oligandrum TaxID=41045 RepID=A0A8K1CIA1_PYTOL|nr:hypothetical protein Poli38472_005255 [Pythium oligandrum]|eukprot:TMW62637.1 hypothetical protein Poli38472_005255 [Pythium oligandrum]